MTTLFMKQIVLITALLILVIITIIVSEKEKNKKIDEYCPHCDTDFEISIYGFKTHKCPNCGKKVLPCAQCVYPDNDIYMDCEYCMFKDKNGNIK